MKYHFEMCHRFIRIKYVPIFEVYDDTITAT
jgi:hypothetical protein